MYEKDVDTVLKIPVEDFELEGNLIIPVEAKGIILFAHGSGSSRHSPRNKQVAEVFQKGSFATLLVDLLTLEEEQVDLRTRHLRFDIEMLGSRLTKICDWLSSSEETRDLKIGTIGSSTGAAAALIAAAERNHLVHAVVSRGGRPDLAMKYLDRVHAPTLLIVGGEDTVVIGMNREALKKIRCEKSLELVNGAAHLFEEPGTLEEAARLAREWFVKHLDK